MADISPTASFNSGEWAPNLFARVDLQKYRSAAALLENFFVDYRGGASTRPGTKYIIQAYKSSTAVRLITFQAAFNLGYELEFGDQYIRFIYQGSPVLENSTTISAATQANPAVLTITGSGYVTGDWIFVSGVGGMTQLNGRYFQVSVSGASVTLHDLNGVAINSTTYTAYTTGGIAQRVYTLASPYAAADLALLKFTQSPNEMILCHPSYPTYILTLISALNWTITAATYGSTALPPSTGLAFNSSLPVANIFTTPVTIGTTHYSYVVTSLDAGGQESDASTTINSNPAVGLVDIRTYPGSNQISWNAVVGAVGYNVYEADVSYFGVQPPGVYYGFIGTCTGTVFIDSNIGPDFSQGPPIHKNPFVGSGVAFVTITAAGTYTSVPLLTGSGGSPTVPATFNAVLGSVTAPTITNGGSGFLVGDTVAFGYGLVMVVTTVSTGAITAWAISGAGAIIAGSTPSNPINQVSTSGAGTGAQATVTWGIVQVIFTPGLGYASAPTITPGSGAATFTTTLSATGAGNPSVPAFFQQRLVLAAPPAAPATFYMSQPGSYFNFDVRNPTQADDAITGTLVSNTLNTIKSIISVPAGMLVFTDQAAWVVNGGSVFQGIATAVSPTTIVAAAQSFIGSSDVPPIIANFDVLYVESKGSKVRDLTYNIYFNVFSGEDISVLSSQLFYGFTITQWAWAEQPFYEVWAVRNDGVMLTLTFLKEQQFSGWSHQVTSGSFKSVATVVEPTSSAGTVNAVYTVVQRIVNGFTVQYIERVAERTFPNGVQDAWCVDSALEYTGASVLSFSGAEHLAGLTVTGLATDNLGNTTIITPFAMPLTGFFSLPAPASPATGYVKVILGLGFTCKLQTMPLDISQEVTQGKPKKIPYVDVRVVDTLGLSIGSNFSTLTPMKDLVQGNISSMLTGLPVQQVSGLYVGDARTFLDPTYTIYGQYCIQQSHPYPATILGVFPAFVIGDDR